MATDVVGGVRHATKPAMGVSRQGLAASAHNVHELEARFRGSYSPCRVRADAIAGV